MGSSALFALSEIENKKQDQRKHNCPIGVPEANRHDLVNADNQKANRQ
jgi:hypothetical protein